MCYQKVEKYLGASQLTNKDIAQKLQFKYKHIKGYLREHLKT